MNCYGTVTNHNKVESLLRRFRRLPSLATAPVYVMALAVFSCSPQPALSAGLEARKTGEVVVSGRVFLPTGGSPAKLAAVWLEGERTEPAPPLARAVIDQREKTFLPHVLMITRGTTVTFPNNDTVFHNVFAYFEARKFDLGMYPRGAVRKQSFDKTGIVALLCNVHPQMGAYIVVVDTPHYRVTDGDGRFRIENVPPGTYTVHVWHESGAGLTEKVTISTERSAPLALTLKR